MREEAAGKTIRLVHAGKLLQDGASLRACGVPDRAFVHAVCSARPAADAGGGEAGAAAVGGGLAGALATGERGFETLQTSGLDANDIEALRAYFYPDVQVRAACTNVYLHVCSGARGALCASA